MNENLPKLLGIRLNEGISKKNLLTFFFVLTFMGLPLMFFVSASQDFFLTTFLKIPSAEQGKVAGYLGFYRELVILFVIGLAGVLADKIGRRTVAVVGFLSMAIGYSLFPFSTNLIEAFIFQTFSAIGNACVTGMMSTVIADYVFDRDRGKASAIQGILIALTFPVVGFVLKPMPKYFQNAGYEEILAGKFSYWLVAGFAVFFAVVLFFGLKGGLPTKHFERKGVLELFREGVAAGRNPGIALSYLSAFVSRSDLAVIGLFLSIWVSNYARDTLGLDSATAAQKAGVVLSSGALAYLISAPIAGFLTDRINRVTALIIAAAIGVVAYLSVISIVNPLSPAMYGIVSLFSIAQIFGVITSQVLISQQAPMEIRGSVIGFFGLCGAAAQIGLSLIGGILFSTYSPVAPFVMVAGMNLVLLIVALFLRSKIKDTGQTVEVVAGH